MHVCRQWIIYLFYFVTDDSLMAIVMADDECALAHFVALLMNIFT